MSEILKTLRNLVISQTAPAGSVWFRDICERVADTEARSLLLSAFAGCGRRLGAEELRVPAKALPPEFIRRAWPLHEAGRVVLLLCHANTVMAGQLRPFLDDLYYRGSLHEREAVLRALPYVPDPVSMVALAVDACRSNAISEFSAIALHNPFPALYFNDVAYFQMVLKALFLEQPIRNTIGLKQRHNSELDRMVRGLVSERKAAGRSISPDIEFLLQVGNETV